MQRKRKPSRVGLLGLLVTLACTSESDHRAGGPASNTPDASTANSVADAEAATRPADAAIEIEALQIGVGEYVFDALAAGPLDGELVLLLHGFPETSYMWRAQLTALAAAGYRAVAPDQRGYSPGARPEDVESYAIAAIFGDAIGMVDALGYERFHVVGHDWGGGVAWALAAILPARVETVTVLSTPHPAALSNALADESSCQYAASAYFETLSAPDASLADVAAIGTGFDGVPEDAVSEYFDAVLSQPDVLDAALNWYRANVADRTLAEPVGAVTVPTVYFWGTADVTFCRETAEASAGYVEAPYRFVDIEGAGHWLAETETEIVTEELLAHLAQ